MIDEGYTFLSLYDVEVDEDKMQKIINLCIIYAQQIEERGGTESDVTMAMLYPILKGN